MSAKRKILIFLGCYFEFLSASITADQCERDDHLFTKSKLDIEFVKSDQSWNVTKDCQNIPQCLSMCKFVDYCKSATFNDDKKKCSLSDCSRSTINTKMIVSSGSETFDKQNCTSTAFGLTEKFIGFVTDANDCYDIYKKGWRSDGVYAIQKKNQNVFLSTHCTMSIHGGGWTTVQRRIDGSVNFARTWEEYKQGFGDLSGEFWYGNEQLHNLTRDRNSELLFVLEDTEGVFYYPFYGEVHIDSEENKYKLTFGAYSNIGNTDITNDLPYHNNMHFSTIDRDNDLANNGCASVKGGGGGWWYQNCMQVNLNGLYGSVQNIGLKWRSIYNANKLIKSTKILIRKKW